MTTTSRAPVAVGLPRVALTSVSVFVVLYLFFAVVIVNVVVPVLVTAAGEGQLGRVATWLVVPIELAGLLSAAAAAYAGLRRTVGDLGELPLQHAAVAIGGPVVVGVVMLALGDPASDVVRSALDLAVLAGGAAVGGWLAAQGR
jgi:hypothetical protein